jgi:hypothetical protein
VSFFFRSSKLAITHLQTNVVNDASADANADADVAVATIVINIIAGGVNKVDVT